MPRCKYVLVEVNRITGERTYHDEHLDTNKRSAQRSADILNAQEIGGNVTYHVEIVKKEGV